MTTVNEKTITKTVSTMLTCESSTVVTREESSISNSMTSTQLLLKPSNKNQKWKIILAITIPFLFIPSIQFDFGSKILQDACSSDFCLSRLLAFSSCLGYQRC
ncbi:unnamed protein product [Rotaria sordida]|uniref:Uncharacterized protein n=1 Tax=Rotaria sordida TaxID=392033 RepID=A0A814WJB7_9BILA|nr:unnamed protein product [Rotaria sordida]CAF1478102.1 unnamed protein product [Rotaria sordida]